MVLSGLLLNTLATISTATILYLWAKELKINPYAPVVLWMVDWSSIAYSTQLMSETVFTPVLLLSAFLTWKKREIPAAIVMGLAILIRPIAIFVPICAFVFGIVSYRYMAIAMAFPLAWTVRNYFVVGVFTFTGLVSHHLNDFVIPQSSHPMKMFMMGIAKTLFTTASGDAFTIAGMNDFRSTKELLSIHPTMIVQMISYWFYLAGVYLLAIRAFVIDRRIRWGFMSVIVPLIVFSAQCGTHRFRIPIMPMLCLAACVENRREK